MADLDDQWLCLCLRKLMDSSHFTQGIKYKHFWNDLVQKLWSKWLFELFYTNLSSSSTALSIAFVAFHFSFWGNEMLEHVLFAWWKVARFSACFGGLGCVNAAVKNHIMSWNNSTALAANWWIYFLLMISARLSDHRAQGLGNICTRWRHSYIFNQIPLNLELTAQLELPIFSWNRKSSESKDVTNPSYPQTQKQKLWIWTSVSCWTLVFIKANLLLTVQHSVASAVMDKMTFWICCTDTWSVQKDRFFLEQQTLCAAPLSLLKSMGHIIEMQSFFSRLWQPFAGGLRCFLAQVPSTEKKRKGHMHTLSNCLEGSHFWWYLKKVESGIFRSSAKIDRNWVCRCFN